MRTEPPNGSGISTYAFMGSVLNEYRLCRVFIGYGFAANEKTFIPINPDHFMI